MVQQPGYNYILGAVEYWLATQTFDWSLGRFLFDQKIPLWNFKNFMWRMEQYFQQISRLVAPAWLDRTVPFTLGRKFPEMQDRQVLETGICRMEQKFMIRPLQPKKRSPPQMVHLLFRKFSCWTETNHSVSDRNFRNFGQMESALGLRIVSCCFGIGWRM